MSPPATSTTSGQRKPAAKKAAPRKAAPKKAPEGKASKGEASQGKAGRNAPKPINLALQGGGAHGAFTWGVLDCLLEDGRVEIEGISGTSAGAMNAVALVDGFERDGPDGARAKLEDLWRAVSRAGRGSPIQRSPIDYLTGNWSLDYSPGFVMFDVLSRFASPYDLNPLNLNPLRDLLEAVVDFEDVRVCKRVKLFVAATNVHTGKVKVFKTEDVTADVVMASACLPYIYQAVEIDGVPYWDGGFMGNPVLFPFFTGCQSPDIMLVQINPVERNETPRSAREILNRMNEITFNSSLLRELRAIEFVSRLIEDERLKGSHYRKIFMHRIGGASELEHLSASSKMNTEWEFLTHLRDIGRETASHWLDVNYEHIGERATIDLPQFIS